MRPRRLQQQHTALAAQSSPSVEEDWDEKGKERERERESLVLTEEHRQCRAKVEEKTAAEESGGGGGEEF